MVSLWIHTFLYLWAQNHILCVNLKWVYALHMLISPHCITIMEGVWAVYTLEGSIRVFQTRHGCLVPCQSTTVSPLHSPTDLCSHCFGPNFLCWRKVVSHSMMKSMTVFAFGVLSHAVLIYPLCKIFTEATDVEDNLVWVRCKFSDTGKSSWQDTCAFSFQLRKNFHWPLINQTSRLMLSNSTVHCHCNTVIWLFTLPYNVTVLVSCSNVFCYILFLNKQWIFFS